MGVVPAVGEGVGKKMVEERLFVGERCCILVERRGKGKGQLDTDVVIEVGSGKGTNPAGGFAGT